MLFTKKQKIIVEAALLRLLNFFQTKTQISHALDITPQYVSHFFNFERKIPIEYALICEDLTKGEVKATELRPDLNILKKFTYFS